ncbi:trimethylamine methyltransferase family protein [bacterium]|nr:trimethylamine methyltransferase family protein [candidate division CSSED10-310 bacterium]
MLRHHARTHHRHARADRWFRRRHLLRGSDMSAHRPFLNILEPETITRIIDQAWEVLAATGVAIENEAVLTLATDHGFPIDQARRRIRFPRHQAEPLLRTAPSSFTMRSWNPGSDLTVGGDTVHFDPGSAAVYWLEPGAMDHRRAESADCTRLARITQLLPHYHLQATGIVPADVPPPMADCHRLLIALAFCGKPIVTGTFRKESFPIMRRMLEVVAGGSGQLRQCPPAIFDCCPSPPLRWSDLTAAALLDCARSGLPAELVAMPLAGATAPVSLLGAVIQHTAENLSGVILHQLAGPGSPIIWGGSPAAFDMRRGTPPMGAMETMLIDLAYVQVGKHLGLPTHAYMACSDAKIPDYQAGMETAMGGVLAALKGINIVSGPGFLNYENTQSLEKLILDHEACAMAYRLLDGIHLRWEPDPVEIIARHAEDGTFLSDPDTRALHREEIRLPGATVFRGTTEEWTRTGRLDARTRAAREASRLLGEAAAQPDHARLEELRSILLAEADRIDCRQAVSDAISEAFGPTFHPC